MYKLFLAAGAAALAMSAPATADPGKGRGGDRRAEKADRGGGDRVRANRSERRAERRVERRAERRSERRVERRSAQRSERRAEQRAERRNERAREARAERRAERRQAERRAELRQERVREARADRREDRAREARVERIRDRREELRDRSDNRRQALARIRDDDRRFRNWDGDRRITRMGDFDDDDWIERRFASRGLPAAFVGCPPGLASKNEFCMPPGQYKTLVGRSLPTSYKSHALPLSLRDLYRDTDDHYWRYGDGYLYRVDRDRDLISSVLPLIGAGLGIGMPFPYSSPNYYVPSSYQSFYPDSPYSYYRYSNGYVYEIDRGSGLIGDIVPLLDSGYGVGQMMPASYSYYNVPYPYRDYYADNDDYYYRYAPGAIYQVDRDTQLITAIASLLMGNGGLSVGQPLPLGYDAYNVPYAYRDRYYDTPDSWYRYANGNIYQVDPTTRLITALVQAIV